MKRKKPKLDTRVPIREECACARVYTEQYSPGGIQARGRSGYSAVYREPPSGTDSGAGDLMPSSGI